MRTSDFQAMLDHPEIDAVWCARGGYGTVRIIDQLDFSNLKIILNGLLVTAMLRCYMLTLIN